MNAPLPLNATSQGNPAVSNERGIDRLFAEMAAMYGSKFADLWAGADVEQVKAKWVEKLKGFSDKPGVIQQAINALDDHPFPPTLPEFLTLCRNAARRIGDGTKALPHKLTDEDHARIKSAAEAAIGGMKAKHSDGIDTHWATHPRGETHLKFIFDAASNDQRFRHCIAEMVSDGICTDDGHLLKSYRDGSWNPVRQKAAA